MNTIFIPVLVKDELPAEGGMYAVIVETPSGDKFPQPMSQYFYKDERRFGSAVIVTHWLKKVELPSWDKASEGNESCGIGYQQGFKDCYDNFIHLLTPNKDDK